MDVGIDEKFPVTLNAGQRITHPDPTQVLYSLVSTYLPRYEQYCDQITLGHIL